jgi:hypothetical protein
MNIDNYYTLCIYFWKIYIFFSLLFVYWKVFINNSITNLINVIYLQKYDKIYCELLYANEITTPNTIGINNEKSLEPASNIWFNIYLHGFLIYDSATSLNSYSRFILRLI